MSVFFPKGEQRGPFAEPQIPRPAATGSTFASINLSRSEASLQKVAIWSATHLIASMLSTLPLDVFEGEKASRRQVPLPKVLEDPAGDGYGRRDWLYQYAMSKLLRGNSYGRVGDRDRMALPTQVVLYHPDEVQGWRDEKTGLPTWRAGGKEVPAEEMWHQRAYPMPGQLLGLSPIAHHALTIGLGIAATRYGMQWFQDGAHPSGMLTNDQALDPKQAKTAKDRFLASLRGSRDVAVLGQGWKYQAIQVSANESQFLETQRYTSAECARIYGPGMPEILGYETGGSMTYANVEQRSLDLLTYTLDPWLVDAEDMFTSFLPPGQYAKLNRAALARTDLLTRFRAHAIALRNQFKTANEVRDDEDMQPVAWGNEPLVLGGKDPEEADK
jgi:HK97 family phage portal protein